MKLLYRTGDYAFIISAIGNCLQQPGQLSNHPKIYVKICPTYLAFSTVTNPATETKSMGLSADAPLSWFLHRHLDYFIIS
jgi:hypothetical protein